MAAASSAGDTSPLPGAHAALNERVFTALVAGLVHASRGYVHVSHAHVGGVASAASVAAADRRRVKLLVHARYAGGHTRACFVARVVGSCVVCC